MPTIRLSYESQGLDVSPSEVSWPILWVVVGVTNEYDAIKFAFWNVPEGIGPFGAAKLARIRIGSRIGMYAWTIETSYSTKRKDAINKGATEASVEDGITPVPNGIRIEYGIGAESRNIKMSRTSTLFRKDGTTFSTSNALIGVDKDGVHGVDISFGMVSFSVTKDFQMQDITEELREKWEELSDPQHVNDDDFGPYAAGEVLFLGISSCRLEGSPTNIVPVTFAFQRRRNQVDVVMSPEVTIPLVKGWEVLDPEFEEVEDTVNHLMKRQMRDATRHQVYPEGDFAELECGL